ncbi:hypothetical protein ACFX15_044738 [Malus domestica]
MKSFQLSQRRSSFARGDASSDFRPLSGAVWVVFQSVGNRKQRRNQTYKSIQKVTYLNCGRILSGSTL